MNLTSDNGALDIRYYDIYAYGGPVTITAPGSVYINDNSIYGGYESDGAYDAEHQLHRQHDRP